MNNFHGNIEVDECGRLHLYADKCGGFTRFQKKLRNLKYHYCEGLFDKKNTNFRFCQRQDGQKSE